MAEVKNIVDKFQRVLNGDVKVDESSHMMPAIRYEMIKSREAKQGNL